jgi:hypothetical protein
MRTVNPPKFLASDETALRNILNSIINEQKIEIDDGMKDKIARHVLLTNNNKRITLTKAKKDLIPLIADKKIQDSLTLLANTLRKQKLIEIGKASVANVETDKCYTIGDNVYLEDYEYSDNIGVIKKETTTLVLRGWGVVTKIFENDTVSIRMQKYDQNYSSSFEVDDIINVNRSLIFNANDFDADNYQNMEMQQPSLTPKKTIEQQDTKDDNYDFDTPPVTPRKIVQPLESKDNNDYLKNIDQQPPLTPTSKIKLAKCKPNQEYIDISNLEDEDETKLEEINTLKLPDEMKTRVKDYFAGNSISVKELIFDLAKYCSQYHSATEALEETRKNVINLHNSLGKAIEASNVPLITTKDEKSKKERKERIISKLQVSNEEETLFKSYLVTYKDFEKKITIPNVGTTSVSETLVNKLLSRAQLHDCVKIVSEIFPTFNMEQISREQLISISKFVQVNGTNQKFSVNIDRYFENRKSKKKQKRTTDETQQHKKQKRATDESEKQDKQQVLFSIQIDGSSYNFHGSDLDRLKDDNWLNDTIMEYYLRYVFIENSNYNFLGGA